MADNIRFAARNTKIPSLLQCMTACAGYGYAYFRTSTRTTNKITFYYRCLVLQSHLRKVPAGPVVALTGPVLVASAPF